MADPTPTPATDAADDTGPYDLAVVPADPIGQAHPISASDSIPYARRQTQRPATLDAPQRVGSHWRNYYLPGLIALAGAIAALLPFDLATSPLSLAIWNVAALVVLLLVGRFVDLDFGILPSAVVHVFALGCVLAGVSNLVVQVGELGFFFYFPILIFLCAILLRLLFNASFAAAFLCTVLILFVHIVLWFCNLFQIKMC